MLDVPKCMAVLSALTSDDLILIEGPPGTGKTQFIVGLIAEELRKNPKSRILLASQTHIAIDNALERLAKWDSNIPMVRIARELSQSVAQSSTQYLLGFQMQAWRKEVVKRSAEGLEEWAKKMGIDATEVKTGTILRQMAATRRRIADTRKKIQEAEARKNSLSQSQKKSGETEFDAESEELLEGLQELRDSHDADKKQYESLQGDLKAYHKEAEHLISQTDSEQDEWAAAFLGDTPVQRKAQRLVELQSQWADRFGSSKGFVRPLIERSAVVAATCVGLSSVEEAAEIQFDLCIIDEASKATAMECSVPMARSRRWVLVGDSKQLPPFQEEILSRGSLREEYGLQSAEADESLFDRMRRMLPDKSKVMLSIQYRMVLPIGRMVSDCFYDGKIESDRHVIDPQLCCLTGLAVNWVSTRNLTDRNEQPSGSSFVNQEESNLILNLLQALDIHLAKVECPNSYSVLVLSGYTAQVQYLDRGVRQIRHKLKRLSVECCTIDRVQGREADAVFFSVTRSNPDRSAGFLKSLERINVALSRAKDLIFIVGDDKFVSEAKNAGPLQKVLMHIEKWPNECRLNVRKSRHSQIREDEHVH